MVAHRHSPQEHKQDRIHSFIHSFISRLPRFFIHSSIHPLSSFHPSVVPLLAPPTIQTMLGLYTRALASYPIATQALSTGKSSSSYSTLLGFTLLTAIVLEEIVPKQKFYPFPPLLFIP